jgi:hypothetical protein
MWTVEAKMFLIEYRFSLFSQKNLVNSTNYKYLKPIHAKEQLDLKDSSGKITDIKLKQYVPSPS